MSLLRSVFTVVSPLVLAAATLSAGCTVPYKAIGCVQDSDCPTQEQIGHDIYDGGDEAPPPAQCCATLCVIPSRGCDTGFRLVAKHSSSYDTSVCAPAELMCVAHDMAQ